MKIALLATTGLYPIEIGGPPSVAYFISRELGRRGAVVYLLARFKSHLKLHLFLQSKQYKELIQNNVKVIPLVLKDYSFVNLARALRLTFLVTSYMRKLINKGVRIVIYNAPPVDISLLVPLISRARRIKQVFILHGGLFYESKNCLGRLIMSLEKGIFDAVITPSEVSKEVALNFGFKKEKVKVIPNGIDLHRLKTVAPLKLDGHPKILYVGRLAPIKDIPTLLLAFKALKIDYPNARLYIVGDGPDKPRLKKIVSQVNLSNSVSFEGEVPTNRAYSYYKSCDIFILPSLRENFPIAILEAMASNIPVIASRSAVPHGLIRSGYNGLLFEEGDWKELVRLMREVLSNKELSNRLIRNAYETVKEFTWRRIGGIYFSLFNSFINS